MIELDGIQVGQEVWYIPQGSLIAIRCKITEIDTQWRERHPEGVLFYWIDEPVGHGLNDDELIETEELAKEILQEEAAGCPHIELQRNDSLDNFRQRVAKFIVWTWKLNPEENQRQVQELLATYPEKQQGVDWFNVKDVELNYLS